MNRNTSIKRWITRYFVLIMLLSMVLYALFNLRKAYSNGVEKCKANALVCAENITSLLDNECTLEEIDDSPGDEVFVEAREVLREQSNSFRMDYVYVYTIDPGKMTRYYYVCAGCSAVEDEISLREFCQCTRPVVKVLDGEYKLLDGERTLQQEYRVNKYGDDIVWIYPYYDQGGNLRALIGMEYNAGRLYESILRHFLNDIIPFAVLILIGMLFLLYILQRRIVTPISELSNSMKVFAQDSRKKPEPLTIPVGDEIGEIAASYEKMTEDISAYVNNIEALTREKLENDVQLSIARRIQYGLVPERYGLEDEGFAVSALTHPAKAVGGDFYDSYVRDDGKVCIVIGDVSGKGISAAIYMSMIKTIIREKMIMGISPGDTLNRTNDELCARNPENLFVTAFVAVLDPATGELVYANAGHTYPVLLKDDPDFLVPESGIALGMFDDSDISDHTMTLLPGQGIVLYTDGVTEAVDEQNRFFGQDRLIDTVRNVSKKSYTAEEVVNDISLAVHDFCGGNEAFDDMAVLALLFKGVDQKSLSVELSAFEEIKKRVFDIAGDTKETRSALLACDEALTNIVTYSGATDLSYSCDEKDGLLRVIFSDNGMPYDQTAGNIDDKEFESLDSGGMGLQLIKGTTRSMHYERKKDRNELTLYFSI